MSKCAHLITIADLTLSQVENLFRVATSYTHQGYSAVTDVLRGKSVPLMFFESSTRTRISFEMAVGRHGGTPLNFRTRSSSTQKGESDLDSVRTVAAMDPAIIVLRHGSTGLIHEFAKESKVPLINAGNGAEEHPTQALIDIFTLSNSVDNFGPKSKILFIGDIEHSRVARSDISLLSRLGVQIYISGPPKLVHPSWLPSSAIIVSSPDEIISEVDAVVALRIQMERHQSTLLDSKDQYFSEFGLTVERAKNMRAEAVVLHPGPFNRGIEIASEVADGPRSRILSQVRNGLYIRMALIEFLIEGSQ